MTEDSRDPLVPLATRDRKERRESLVHPAPPVREAQLGQLAPLENAAAKAPKAHRAPKVPVDPPGSLALRDPVGTQAPQAHQARMDSLAPKALLASRDCKALWGSLGCLDREGCQACLGYQACRAPKAPPAPQAHLGQQCPWPYRTSQPQHLRPTVSLSPPSLAPGDRGSVYVLVAGPAPVCSAKLPPHPFYAAKKASCRAGTRPLLLS